MNEPLKPCGLCNPRTRFDGTPGKPSKQPHKCWENFFKTHNIIKQAGLLISSESWKTLNAMRWALVEKKYSAGLTQEEHETLLILSKRRISYEIKETHVQWLDRKMKERFDPDEKST